MINSGRAGSRYRPISTMTFTEVYERIIVKWPEHIGIFDSRKTDGGSTFPRRLAACQMKSRVRLTTAKTLGIP